MTAPPNSELASFVLTEADREVLSLSDEDFVFHDWENLKDIIGMFHRVEFLFLPVFLFSSSPFHVTPISHTDREEL